MNTELARCQETLTNQGIRPLWGGNGQGLIVVAAYLNNLVKKEYMRGDGSRRGLICNLFVSHPLAKVGILSTEVCVHNMASAAHPAAVNRTNI